MRVKVKLKYKDTHNSKYIRSLKNVSVGKPTWLKYYLTWCVINSFLHKMLVAITSGEDIHTPRENAGVGASIEVGIGGESRIA